MILHNLAYIYGIFILRIDIYICLRGKWPNHTILKIFYWPSSWFGSRFSSWTGNRFSSWTGNRFSSWTGSWFSRWTGSRFSSWTGSWISSLILIACRDCTAHIIDTFHWSITELSTLQICDLLYWKDFINILMWMIS